MTSEEMRKKAKELDKWLNPSGEKLMGFALFVFPFGTGGKTDYISNAHREDMIMFIEEYLERAKTGRSGERKAEFTDSTVNAIMGFIKGLSPEEKRKLLED